jgi:hypothetical protein
MPDILIRLRNFETEEAANKTAEDIRNAGGITYVDAEGGEVNVTVGDVTVET